MRLLLAVLLLFGFGCAPRHAEPLSDPSPPRVVVQGASLLTMEVQELI